MILVHTNALVLAAYKANYKILKNELTLNITVQCSEASLFELVQKDPLVILSLQYSEELSSRTDIWDTSKWPASGLVFGSEGHFLKIFTASWRIAKNRIPHVNPMENISDNFSALGSSRYIRFSLKWRVSIPTPCPKVICWYRCPLIGKSPKRSPLK